MSVSINNSKDLIVNSLQVIQSNGTLKTVETLISDTAAGIEGTLSPEQIATISGLSAALGNDPAYFATTTAAIALKADITNVYTKSAVDTKISDLIGGAPSQLNTLKEIATALNDDNNLAGTLTTAISLKSNITDTFKKTIVGNIIYLEYESGYRMAYETTTKNFSIDVFISSAWRPVLELEYNSGNNTFALNVDNKLMAPINNPTFTGTVAGITQTMVGLSNVSNTADADKPISTLTQAALDLKANLSTTPTKTTSGAITYLNFNSKSRLGFDDTNNKFIFEYFDDEGTIVTDAWLPLLYITMNTNTNVPTLEVDNITCDNITLNNNLSLSNLTLTGNANFLTNRSRIIWNNTLKMFSLQYYDDETAPTNSWIGICDFQIDPATKKGYVISNELYGDNCYLTGLKTNTITALNTTDLTLNDSVVVNQTLAVTGNITASSNIIVNGNVNFLAQRSRIIWNNTLKMFSLQYYDDETAPTNQWIGICDFQIDPATKKGYIISNELYGDNCYLTGLKTNTITALNTTDVTINDSVVITNGLNVSGGNLTVGGTNIITSLGTKAPINNPTFTGNVVIGSTNVITELGLKAPKAAPTFTGTATFNSISSTGTTVLNDAVIQGALVTTTDGLIIDSTAAGNIVKFYDSRYVHFYGQIHVAGVITCTDGIQGTALYWCAGRVDTDGTILNSKGYQTFTVSKGSPGQYTITMAVSHPDGANYVVVASGRTFHIPVFIDSSTVFRIQPKSAANANEDADFTFLVLR